MLAVKFRWVYMTLRRCAVRASELGMVARFVPWCLLSRPTRVCFFCLGQPGVPLAPICSIIAGVPELESSLTRVSS